MSAVSAMVIGAGLTSGGNASAATAPASIVKASSTISAVANPALNSSPKPDYNVSCWSGTGKGPTETAQCHTQQLAAINRQHALEHIRPIALPRNYWSLTPALQTFVIINLERVSRGLKPIQGVNAQMSGWATTAVRHNSDVSVGAWDLANGSHLQIFGSVWAGDLNPLDADFIWMYADGWAKDGSSNADCTSAKAAGCWSHRQVILGRYAGSGALVAGVASLQRSVAGGLLDSDAEAIANYTGPVPKFTYTWTQAVAAGAH